jgi:HAD superfamily hydrolase (TIGR01662 family)
MGFDLDHTLAIDNRLERVALLRLLELVLAEGGHTLGTLSDEIDNIDTLLTHQRRGEFSIDDAVRRFTTQHGLKPRGSYVESFRANAVGMVGEFVVPLPGVRRTLAALRERGIVLAVLTNGWNPMQRLKAEQAGFLGPILVSSEIGVRKPEPGAFEILLRTLGTQPQQTFYVGDDPSSDVAGAQRAGMRTVWINWERLEYPPGQRPPDHTIGAFDELLELVAAPVRAS